MKILLCLNKDIYCCYALNLLLKNLDLSQTKVYFSNQVGSTPINSSSLSELKKIEQDISSQNINHLLTKSEENVDVKNFLTFEEIISNYQLQILDFKNINQDGLEYLKNNWHPDLIVSLRFGQIFKNPIISIPKFGIINLHSGILPDYRGIMASFWAMKNNEKEIGCTLHFIEDSSIDTGGMIDIFKIKADYQKPLIANIFRLYKGGVKMILDNINILKNNSIIKIAKQDDSSSQYFSYPTEDDIKKSNLKLI